METYLRVKELFTPQLDLPADGLWQIVEERTGRILGDVAESPRTMAFVNSWSMRDTGEPLAYVVEVRAVRVRGGRTVRPGGMEAKRSLSVVA